MVDESAGAHSMGICRLYGQLCFVDSWEGTAYDLYTMPDAFVITSLTLIYNQ